MPYFHYEVCMIYHRKYKKKSEEKISVLKTLHLVYGVQKEEEKKTEQAPTNHHNHQKNKNKQGRR